MDGAEIFDGKVGGRTLTSRGSGAWKEEMNMKLIVFRQVQPGATPCIYMRSPGKRAFAFLSIAFSLRVHAFSPPPPTPHSFHFSRPLAISFLPPPLRRIFERLFTRVLSHNSTVSYEASASATTMDKRAEKGRRRKSRPASRYCSSL